MRDDWNYLKYEDLPLVAKHLSDCIGFNETVKLMKVMPVSGVYITHPQSIAKTIIGKTLNKETAEKIAVFYQGETLCLCKSLALKKAKNRRIKAEAENNIRHFSSKSKYYAYVSEKEGICISRIREIINSI